MSKISTSKALPHHLSEYPLLSDRNYIIIDESAYRSDLSMALKFAAEKVEDHDVEILLIQLAESVEKGVDHEKISTLCQESRRLIWQRGPKNRTWADFVLMISSFLQGASRITKRERQ